MTVWLGEIRNTGWDGELVVPFVAIGFMFFNGVFGRAEPDLPISPRINIVDIGEQGSDNIHWNEGNSPGS